ncbi:MAG: NfeD family protein [Syntrophomonadaceae bacterium]|jgi:membrane protein implicated in regulation of membrane protease activity|nr:NfeD family protein [Syntrophomonadaceae bacterium]
MSALQWVLVALVCGIIELASAGLWFLWLALAALLTALGIKTGLLLSLQAQLLVFAVFTLAFIVFTRPLALKFLETKDTPSNVNALIGQYGIVTQAISPIHYGQAKVNGEIWTATAAEDIEVDARIRVVGIEGVKLLVEKAPREQ